MDFSPEILIEFGFNLAGYTVVALLVYLVAGRRSHKAKTVTVPGEVVPVTEKLENSKIKQQSARMEFVAFGEKSGGAPAEKSVDSDSSGSEIPRVVTRRESRRAIYQEARRLLAKGKSGSELMGRLPITEDEIGMLSLSRQV